MPAAPITFTGEPGVEPDAGPREPERAVGAVVADAPPAGDLVANGHDPVRRSDRDGGAHRSDQ
ncbi:hypothetical protein GCM10010185_70300 [Saccharothrix coeruleofusca]|uniref:Uncharacterized protein n=1 Tax=Saccharothrix coeruleofusca TaxID=33919 RepID=A0A918EIJ2_9PSEU|nr:hypothetical protein [Saccharothrix coeruleofusca]MBP2335662.1 hypothetical protein [Saccharothrix coeruleofusca]GGP86502.1 hypothetical protein GCM10010185_70300 [Saccharothrix coeruleofusca]